MEGVLALIGFKGPDQPPLGPFLYLFQAQVPTSALGLSVLAAVRQIDSRIQQNEYRITSLAQKYTNRFCYLLFLSLQWSVQDLKKIPSNFEDLKLCKLSKVIWEKKGRIAFCGASTTFSTTIDVF